MSSIQNNESPRILLVRPDALGDVVLLLPTVMALRNRWPTSIITVLASQNTSELLEKHPQVNAVWLDPFKKGRSYRGLFAFSRKIKQAKFDIVIHAFNEGPYVLSTWLAQVPIRVGDKQKVLLKPFHTHRIRQDFDNPNLHEVDLNLQLLQVLGITPPLQGNFGWERVDFPVIQTWLPEKYVVIHPGVGLGNRCIPSGIFRGLIQYLSSIGMGVVLTGSSAEALHNSEIAKDLDQVIDITGKTNLLQLAGVIRNSIMMVSVDTGPMHLAASLGVRVLNLSPSKYVKPTRWGPYGVHHRVVRPDKICSYRCFPYACTRGHCTDAIDPSVVKDALQELLNIPFDAKAPSIVEAKLEWQRVSLSVLDLRQSPNPEDVQGYRYYQKSEVSGFIWKWVVIQDVGFFLVDRRRFWHPVMERILALWLYYPPRFLETL